MNFYFPYSACCYCYFRRYSAQKCVWQRERCERRQTRRTAALNSFSSQHSHCGHSVSISFFSSDCISAHAHSCVLFYLSISSHFFVPHTSNDRSFHSHTHTHSHKPSTHTLHVHTTWSHKLGDYFFSHYNAQNDADNLQVLHSWAHEALHIFRSRLDNQISVVKPPSSSLSHTISEHLSQSSLTNLLSDAVNSLSGETNNVLVLFSAAASSDA